MSVYHRGLLREETLSASTLAALSSHASLFFPIKGFLSLEGAIVLEATLSSRNITQAMGVSRHGDFTFPSSRV